LIHQVIDNEEASRRKESYPAEVVDQVFRFGSIIGCAVFSHASLHRGMDYARDLICEKEAAGQSLASGAVILAGELTGGKGRFSREWFAPAGGIWMTVVLANVLLPETSRLLPLAAGIACCELLRDYGVDARIKWVNDVHVRNRKIAGILTETFLSPRHREEYILVGLGININNQEFPQALTDRAVSLRDLRGELQDLTLASTRLLAKLVWNYGLLCYEEERRLAGREDISETAAGEHLLLDRWRNLSDTIGRRVRFGFDVEKLPQFEAVAQGIDPSGALILHLPGAQGVLVEHAGEIVYLD
jgi:BirA family biotin operon repressor/biotin-[acetyl-CoA-carboxylase] ligase